MGYIPLEGEFQYRVVHVVRDVDIVEDVPGGFPLRSTRSVTLRLGVETIIKSADLGSLLHTLSR